MNQILILFAHPALEKSRIQYRLMKAASGIEGVTVHDLYQVYPDLMIDVPHEQALLSEHDIILFQHPFYWYSAPAIVKEWQDLVLEYGYAYGPDGTALHGKTLGNVISTGGDAHNYQPGRRHNHSIGEFLIPFEQTAAICGMHYLPPFAVHGAHDISGAKIDEYAEHYRQVLWHLQRSLPDQEALATMHTLNHWTSHQG